MTGEREKGWTTGNNYSAATRREEIITPLSVMQEFRFERGKGNRMKPEHTYFQVVTLEGVEVKVTVRFKEVV